MKLMRDYQLCGDLSADKAISRDYSYALVAAIIDSWFHELSTFYSCILNLANVVLTTTAQQQHVDALSFLCMRQVKKRDR